MAPKDVLSLCHRKGIRSIDYEQLKGRTLKSLFAKSDCYLILFSDHSKGHGAIGHFCLLYRFGGEVTFFDPLGLGLRNVTSVTHSRKHLQKLLQGHDYLDNRVKYQKLASDVNTCGRWCATRWNCAQLGPKAFERLFHNHKSLDGDEIVVLMTMEQDLTKLKQTK